MISNDPVIDFLNTTTERYMICRKSVSSPTRHPMNRFTTIYLETSDGLAAYLKMMFPEIEFLEDIST